MIRRGFPRNEDVGRMEDGDGAPPSTLAAQIVHNRSAFAREHPENQVLFGKLLREYLQNPLSELTSLPTSAQLITVVVEAGLDPVNASEAPSKSLNAQAVDGLRVIATAVSKNPDVVLFREETTNGPRPTMFLWLFAKLLTACSVSSDVEVTNEIHNVICACLNAVRKLSRSWKRIVVLKEIIRRAADDALAVLRASSPIDGTRTKRVFLKLPSVSSFALLSPSNPQFLVVPPGHQASFYELKHVCKVFTLLLRIIQTSSVGDEDEVSPHIGANRAAWIASSTKQLFRYFPPIASWSSLDRDVFLTTVCYILHDVACQQCLPDMSARQFQFLFEMAVLVRSHTCCTSSSSLQTSLGRLLLVLRIHSSRFREDQQKDPIGMQGLNITRLLGKEQDFGRLISDLQYSLTAWLPTSIPEDNEMRIITSRRADLVTRGPDCFNEHHLAVAYTRLALANATGPRLDGKPDDEPPAKRQKQEESREFSTSTYHHLVSQLYTASSVTMRSPSITPFAQGETISLHQLTSDQAHQVLSCLQVLPCSGSNAFVASSAASGGETYTCRVCDNFNTSIVPAVKWNSLRGQKELSAAISLSLQFAQNDDGKMPLLENRSSIVAANAVVRILNHMESPNHLRIADDLGQWILRSLRDPLREVRLASARALAPFLSETLPLDILSANRVVLLDFLRTLSERNNLPEQESLVFAWALVGRFCSQNELVFVLLQLVDYLGHTHALVATSAYDAIHRLANHMEQSVTDLFKHHWHTIALDVVKDLIRRPQKAQQLAELLSVSVDELLVQTQTYTVPHLVLGKRVDLLRRIAQARGAKTSIHDVVLQPPKNLAAVLALLLMQPHLDVERSAIITLKEAVGDFGSNDLSNLVRLEPISTACELLFLAGDGIAGQRTQAWQAFKLLAAIAQRKSPSAKAAQANKALNDFLTDNILGIMASFNDTLDTSKDLYSSLDRRRALKAVQQLVEIAEPPQISMSLPQLKATLQTALRLSDLIDETFHTWATLVARIGADDLESLVDQTFAVIAQFWEQFSPVTQTAAHDVIARLLKTHNSLIRDRIEMIPDLPAVPLLQKFQAEVTRLKTSLDYTIRLEAFSRRVQDENSTVVRQSLLELHKFIEKQQLYTCDVMTSQQAPIGLQSLFRSLLDVMLKYKEVDDDILEYCGRCLAILGVPDSNLMEALRVKQEVIVLWNFEKAPEVIHFAATLLESVIIKAFHSAVSGKTQTYLAYVMQELLKLCGFHQAYSRQRASQGDEAFKRWSELSETARLTLGPYFNSRYHVVNPAKPTNSMPSPIFDPRRSHGTWLRTFVFHLMHKAKGENAEMLFTILSRVIFGHDLAISSFLLPYVVQNVVLGGTVREVDEILSELLAVLTCSTSGDNTTKMEIDCIKHCSEDVFQILDYLSRWLQEKRRVAREYALSHGRHVPADYDEISHVRQISSVERLFSGISADLVAARAMECGSYARALLNWEQHLRRNHSPNSDEDELASYLQLQQMYAKIEEPDAIEGLSARLHILDPEQQIQEHKRAGRWSAAQTWYEDELVLRPQDHSLQLEVLQCMKVSGQHEALLNFVDSLTSQQPDTVDLTLPFAAEAAWNTGRWIDFERLLGRQANLNADDFSTSIARALLFLKKKAYDDFSQTITDLYNQVVRTFTPSTSDSLRNAHDPMLKLHALYEVEALGLSLSSSRNPDHLVEILNRRLNILGSSTDDKQYLLALRRATMQFIDGFEVHTADAWLQTASLARQNNNMAIAYHAVLCASRYDNQSAGVEHSRLLWKDGQHRKAIDNLRSVIESKPFLSFANNTSDSVSTIATADSKDQNQLLGETQLLLANWMNEAGLIKYSDLLRYYHSAQKSWNRSQDILYHIAKYYNKIFDAEKAAPRSKQTITYMNGECAKLAIENYLRSMVFGSRHYYETVPKMLTFWLDLGMEVAETPARRPNASDVELSTMKSKRLDAVHKQIRKYVERLPAYVFYGALPQMMSRISHPHLDVTAVLSFIIGKVIGAYPQQALWSILAVAKSRQADKATRANEILNIVKRAKTDSTSDFKSLLTQGQRLTEGLLAACEATLDPRSSSHISLQRDLHFNHKLAPCGLVVPVDKGLVATLPSGHGGATVRTHRPFALKPVTIAGFLDDVLVLNSLQRPRKLNVRGSDGQVYGLLCKPKDDLRKDQRLMEYNAMICRGLKWNAASSKRQLYIRMYAVTPLNEECGAIEWVDGLKPMRDIILDSYRSRGIKPNYGQLRDLLDKASAKDEPNGHQIFTNEVLPAFPPVLHEWFVTTFPDPSTWFGARLRYTRSCAVMSIVGHSLGLGDRHGENILLEEGTGGVFHVDFNCLFDKGLTFEKPEMVPFRLTHNMIDAFGLYKYEGPYRIAAELTLQTLRQHEDTLMTILETFLYDPTTDFVATAKPKKRVQGVPETPKDILESVRAKIRGFLPQENMPLSVDGYVEALIKSATSPVNLSAMYIGWCAFF